MTLFLAVDFTVFRPSSFHIIIQSMVGLQVQVQLVPLMQVYITVDQSFQGKTCGENSALKKTSNIFQWYHVYSSLTSTISVCVKASVEILTKCCLMIWRPLRVWWRVQLLLLRTPGRHSPTVPTVPREWTTPVPTALTAVRMSLHNYNIDQREVWIHLIQMFRNDTRFKPGLCDRILS